MAALLAVTSSVTMAQEGSTAGAQFSSVPNFNAPANATKITGVRLAALYGKSDVEVVGADFALLGLSEVNDIKGVTFPLFIGANKVNGDMTGASFGIFGIHKGKDIGANLNLVNITNHVQGANVGLVNIGADYTMVDVSFVNLVPKSNVQVGIFNKVDNIKYVQVGLINCAKNGFLPCFPIVNFPVK